MVCGEVIPVNLLKTSYVVPSKDTLCQRCFPHFSVFNGVEKTIVSAKYEHSYTRKPKDHIRRESPLFFDSDIHTQCGRVLSRAGLEPLYHYTLVPSKENIPPLACRACWGPYIK